MNENQPPVPENGDYQIPPVNLLNEPLPIEDSDEMKEEILISTSILERKLSDFGVEGKVIQVLPGPVITLYEFEPAPGIKVSRILALSDDLALAMRALSLRILAPVPGKPVVGIEIPNIRKEVVSFKEIITSKEFVKSNSKLMMVVGKDNIGEPVAQSLKEGLRFVFKTKAILGAISLDMIAVLFGGAVALLPVFAQDILKVGPEGFGMLRAAPAVGAFMTMLVTAYIPISKHAGLKLLVAIFGFGISIVVFGLSSIFWISLVALFFSGVTDGVSMVIRQTILQLKTPDHMRGRVSSVNSMFVGSSNELGAFESGVTAKLMGTVTAVVFGGAMTLITVITTGIVSPTFRKLDLQKDLEAHEK